MIAVSACLTGIPCRYDGKSIPVPGLDNILKTTAHVVFCPEVMGGLPTPRPPSEIVRGDGNDVLAHKATVMDARGHDLSAAFVAGAETAMALIKKQGAAAVVLKEESPSCGVHLIHDGTFSGRLTKGCGVMAALVTKEKLPVFTEREIVQLRDWMKNRKEDDHETPSP